MDPIVRRLLPLALGVLLPIAGSAQETGVAGSISLQADGGFDSADLSDADGPLADSLALGTAHSSAGGSYSVGFGVIRPSASTLLEFPDCGSDPPSCPAGTSASASGNWIDYVTVDPQNGGLIGQPGSIQFRISVDGTGFAMNADATFVASSFYFLSVGVDETNENRQGFYVTPGNLGGDDFGESLFSAPIVFGQPFRMQVMLETTASVAATSANGPGTYASEMDLSSTLRWLGIEEVRDSGGEPVVFSVSSESGVDWALPVPEPTAAGCAQTALAAIAWRARGRASRRRV